MKRKLSLLAAVSTLALPVVPNATVSAASAFTAVTALSGDPVDGVLEISGTATFGGQLPVEVADDPANDAGITPNVGDHDGLDRENGVDLIGATMSVPDPAAPELLVQWQLSALPPSGAIPEGVGYSLPFKVGSSVYQVQAKWSNATDPETPPDTEHLGAAFELRGNCAASVQGTNLAHCSHLAWITGGFDTVNSIVHANVPLGSAAAPDIVPGAPLLVNNSSNPQLNDVMAGYQAGGLYMLEDHASFSGFTIPAKEVRLGVAPVGTDPETVEFPTPTTLAADGSFTGEVSTIGMQPGTFDVFARACFADNCGVRSLGGVSETGDGTVGNLRITADERDSFVFWDGGKIGNQVPYSLPLPNNGTIQTCSNTPCFRYKLKVGSPDAARLRIALDTSTRNDNFTFQVTPPSGTPLPAITNGNAFNSETFIANPAVGTYDILVRPYSAQNTRFAMRAKLEATIPTFPPNEDGLLLPDLRPTAPYELGFAAPVPPNGGFPPDDANPPLDVAGVHPISCAPDESLDDHIAVKCLRFSFGLANYGHGRFNIHWTGGASTQLPGLACGEGFSVSCPGPMYQCVEAPEQTAGFVERPAGEWQFHYTHGHTHYKDIISVGLFTVVNPTAGTMRAAGQGRKLGYSPANQAIADWFVFDQRTDEGNSVPGCGVSPQLGMRPGWGDVYRYQRPGNYVDFGTNPDGLYVVRLTADPLNNVLESNESNNAGYTYVRVTGDKIDVLEHGRGLSPWDPDKEVLKPRYRGGVPW